MPQNKKAAEQNHLSSRKCTAKDAGDFKYEVRTLGNQFVVDLLTCRFRASLNTKTMVKQNL